MAELQNKHLLIVGGSSGIGFAIAQRAGLEGARLTLMGVANNGWMRRALC